MTGKLPTVEDDFGVAAFREFEFEEAVLLGEVEFVTSATMPDDWPKVSAAAAVKNSAAAGSSKRIRRNLLIFFIPPNYWALDLVIELCRYSMFGWGIFTR
jgi:hypothetical protein